MNTQFKTLIKFVLSLVGISVVFNFVFKNLVISVPAAFLISVTYFYSPEKLIARREKEEAEKELVATENNDTLNNKNGNRKGNNKKSKKNK
ncbi:MAG: hypothetical protein KIB43_02405 [Clostridium baratii]|uniref:hypothetical protein n=1 Tax=Clostridium baratii TaxID=1561 RepID=UPI0006C18A5E|nr:hypothetical protein [Clostridium baratii]MBS6005790.1 hypothetical protein [Clostridium baratii]MDU1052857.1 hypothetical protein [Clostridium baratii]CUP22656.1 Uncharacterised protein [Clostridium baratii]